MLLKLIIAYCHFYYFFNVLLVTGIYNCIFSFSHGLIFVINVWGSADCIGSAFNIKGAMQCPNCRKIEKGQWLYANGCRTFSEFNMDDWAHDEDLYDLSYSEMVNGL